MINHNDLTASKSYIITPEMMKGVLSTGGYNIIEPSVFIPHFEDDLTHSKFTYTIYLHWDKDGYAVEFNQFDVGVTNLNVEEVSEFKNTMKITVNNEPAKEYTMTDNIDACFDVIPQTNKYTIKPNCVCYLNNYINEDGSEDKTQIFTVESNGLFDDEVHITATTNGSEYGVRAFIRPYIRIQEDVEGGEVIYNDKLQPAFELTFNLMKDTKKDYKATIYIPKDAYPLFDLKEDYIVDEQNIIIERQEYCHNINIEVKIYDKEGNETDKFPHPTSSDWSEDKYGEITVKITIKDEQGNYVDVPIENINTNWQYSITGSNGQYEMKIPNSSTDALPINDYIISLYINKDWTVENGYYNKYIIEANDILINDDKIEKVGLWNNEHIDHYSNGITYLDGVYETVSGLFVNSMKQFSVVDSLNEVNERKQYSYCYRVYDAPMTLNLPNYTEDELADIAKAIVRELGQPRKIETYTILSKEIPKINSNITLNHNGALLSLPVYTVEFSLANSNISSFHPCFNGLVF